MTLKKQRVQLPGGKELERRVYVYSDRAGLFGYTYVYGNRVEVLFVSENHWRVI